MRDGRRRTGRAARLLAGGLIACGVLAAGCDTLDGAQRVVDRADLVNDLATRLDHTETLTYTAEYQVAGGASATIAKGREPSRIAYTYPGGKLIMMPHAYTDCRGTGSAVRCTVSPVASPDPGPPSTLFADLGTHGLITPPVVVGLLNATALDTDAAVRQRDTTIAGQHATCLDVAAVDNAAASTFEVCVTTDGVLGSFSGLVNGNQIDLALTQYRGAVGTDAFDPPPGAAVIDRAARK